MQACVIRIKEPFPEIVDQFRACAHGEFQRNRGYIGNGRLIIINRINRYMDRVGEQAVQSKSFQARRIGSGPVVTFAE